MIISRTPYRISFFGGGTDYPVWYRENEGAVLSTTIDKYCFISCRHLPPFFEHKHRIVYSRIESVKDVSEIEHPSVKATFQYMGINNGLEIHHDGDLPARTGLGSSSSFTVGLLNTLYAMNGTMPSKKQLAQDAIEIEQNIIKESVGSQDQISASFGGFNKITFNSPGRFQVKPIIINHNRFQQLQSHLMFFFTGFSRFASEIAKSQIENSNNRKHELWIIRQMVDEAISILNKDNNDIAEFGKLLHEAWKLKKSLSDKVTTPQVDEIYNTALKAGALGGKLTGAGGGGFMLIFAKPENQPLIREKLKGLLLVPIKFENDGSQIIVYQPEKQMIENNDVAPKPYVSKRRRRTKQKEPSLQHSCL